MALACVHKTTVADFSRIAALSRKLFSPDIVRAEVLRSCSCLGVTEVHLVDDLLVLDADFVRHQNHACHMMYLIPKRFSWGRLEITWEVFEKIMMMHDVFAPFLDLVVDFAQRIQEVHTNTLRLSTHLHNSTGAEEVNPFFEICYKIPYVERNHRNRGDPWSLRQAGVYHYWLADPQRSVWIFLHLPARLHSVLGGLAGEAESPCLSSTRLHSRILWMLERNWADYLEHLSADLAHLSEKACFAETSCHRPYDYAISFSQCQELQVLRDKLFRVDNALDHCSEIGIACQNHSEKINALGLHVIDTHEASGVEGYLRSIRHHTKRVNTMLQRSQDIMVLLNRLIAVRNDEVTHDANVQMQAALSTIRSAVSDTYHEHREVTQLARQSAKDSRRLMALTSVATMYLPATLVATIFSSNLIQWIDGSAANINISGSRYFIVPQFWISILCTLILICLTVAGIRCLERSKLCSRQGP